MPKYSPYPVLLLRTTTDRQDDPSLTSSPGPNPEKSQSHVIVRHAVHLFLRRNARKLLLVTCAAFHQHTVGYAVGLLYSLITFVTVCPVKRSTLEIGPLRCVKRRTWAWTPTKGRYLFRPVRNTRPSLSLSLSFHPHTLTLTLILTLIFSILVSLPVSVTPFSFNQEKGACSPLPCRFSNPRRQDDRTTERQVRCRQALEKPTIGH